MIGLTNDEARAQLTGHPGLRCEAKNLWFDNPEASSIKVDLRVKEPHQLVYLARLAAHLGHEEGHFGHALLWITTWGVWSNHDEAIAFKTLEQFRRSYGEVRSIEAAPGTYFRHDEFTESVSCLLQPMLIGWDAHYVPTWAAGGLDYFVSVSHDGFIDIEVRTKETHDEVVDIFRSHNWIDALMKY
jgi:hypothetical protein